MINLSLIRHAKSNWLDYDGNDYNRPISEIGRERTLQICNFLKKKKIFVVKKFFAHPQKEQNKLKIS